jgi:hypothetical protein
MDIAFVFAAVLMQLTALAMVIGCDRLGGQS